MLLQCLEQRMLAQRLASLALERREARGARRASVEMTIAKRCVEQVEHLALGGRNPGIVDQRARHAARRGASLNAGFARSVRAGSHSAKSAIASTSRYSVLTNSRLDGL